MKNGARHLKEHPKISKFTKFDGYWFKPKGMVHLVRIGGTGVLQSILSSLILNVCHAFAFKLITIKFGEFTKGAFVWEYSGIRIYSGIYSGYSAPGSRIAGMEIQVFRNRKSIQTNANLHYSNYSYSGLIPNERALSCISPGLITAILRYKYPAQYAFRRQKKTGS